MNNKLDLAAIGAARRFVIRRRMAEEAWANRYRLTQLGWRERVDPFRVMLGGAYKARLAPWNYYEIQSQPNPKY